LLAKTTGKGSKMLMRILYPSDPSNPRAPDDPFAAEYEAARSVGLPLSLFSFEDFETGGFRARPSFGAGEQVLYRGWMLAADRYPARSLIVSTGRWRDSWTCSQALRGDRTGRRVTLLKR
jgi:hypothetical protein